MENKLDARSPLARSAPRIATGKENWQKYLTGWNREYFEGALASANKYLAENGFSSNANGGKQKYPLIEVKCPQCNRYMSKVPSKSKNLAVPYFLKCGHCKVGNKDLVMFFNEKQQEWVQPIDLPPTSEQFTDFKCPVCDAFLVEHEYQKNSQTRKMLRCALANKSKKKHKDVAFFWTKNQKWWSKKYGELN